MAKAKAKDAAPKKMAADSKAKTAEEIQKVRNSVTNMILSSSEEMAARVVQSVIEGGQVAAKILLARMGLQGKVPVIVGDEEGDVESEEDLQKSD